MTKTKPASTSQADILARVMNSEQRRLYGKLMVNDATINLNYAERLVAALKRVGYEITKRPTCVSPTGRTDCHLSYVKTGPDGKLVCIFCKQGPKP